MPVSTDGTSTTTVPKPAKPYTKSNSVCWRSGGNKTINTKEKQRLPPQLFPLREAPGQGGGNNNSGFIYHTRLN